MIDFENVKNNLLAKLPQHILQTVLRDAEIVHYDLRETIVEANTNLAFVDFPENGVLSLLQNVKDGEPIEIATVGKEGMCGFGLTLGIDASGYMAICQVEGQGYRFTKAQFQQHLKAFPEFKRLCELYMIVLFDQVSRTLACNRNHSFPQRCARWLLMTQDRCDSQSFVLTQDFLALMLGCSRTVVNAAAGELQKAGYINYVRGKILILDRPGLEQICCSCYQEMQNFSNQLLFLPTPSNGVNA